jgi:hypothetical protein
LVERAVVFAVDGGLAAVDVGEGTGACQHRFGGVSGANGRGHIRVFLGQAFIVFGHFDVVEGGFGSPGAVEAELGDGELFDEADFGGSGGAVFVHIFGKDEGKSFWIFAGEGDVGCGESVAEGVAGRDFLAHGGDGSAGFGAVAAGGFFLGFGPGAWAARDLGCCGWVVRLAGHGKVLSGWRMRGPRFLVKWAGFVR